MKSINTRYLNLRVQFATVLLLIGYHIYLDMGTASLV